MCYYLLVDAFLTTCQKQNSWLSENDLQSNSARGMNNFELF